MKKGLIEFRTGREYIPGLPKEEYEDEIVDAGFEVDYESFKEGEHKENGNTSKIDLESLSLSRFEN